jgi:transposase InsO family protein
MCHLLGVSRSAFYGWQERPVRKRQQENKRLLDAILEIHGYVRETYGSPRMKAELQGRGYLCGHNRVARIMKENGVMAKTTARFRGLTKSGRKNPPAPNILDRKFRVAAPNRVWVSDITYIPTAEGFLYLAVVLDLFSRRVVGWGMSPRLNPELVGAALRQALARRDTAPGLLHHSDQDILYSCGFYQQLLTDQGMNCSMSRKGNCYDNAVAESFFGSLKNELVAFERFQSRDQAALEIFDWIEVFYNGVRRHSTLDFQSPVDYEKEKH